MSKIAFTAQRVAAFRCPEGKDQAFLWDATTQGLGLRATAAGARAYIFQSTLAGKSLRMTIGSPETWTIPQAQKRARELQAQIDSGRDPRVVQAEQVAADAAARALARGQSSTVADAWTAYVADRRPHWGKRHAEDHDKMTRAGGEKPKRGLKGGAKSGRLTGPGPLHALMGLTLTALDGATVEKWAAREAETRPTQARLALRLLKAFLTWCAESDEYRAVVPKDHAAKSRKARRSLGEPKAKQDVLLREQLPAWFGAVRALANPMHSVYLQCLLLVGCRPGEMHDLRWSDIDLQWRSLRLRDKVEGERTIPLTPEVSRLLGGLPRRTFSDGKPNPWVFSSASAVDGRMAYPSDAHTRACAGAGLGGLTPHGLRRSFKSLTEWLEIPAGVVAQLQGHRPSATAEKHYTVRPLDLLRIHHERIEKWMLAHAEAKPGSDAPVEVLHLKAAA